MFDKLSAPFDVTAVSWRVGSTNGDKTRGIALAYIDARDVMDRLDSVCGPAGWQNRYTHTAAKTVCEIGIKIDGEWVWKADGAGDTDYEAEKGALSDAFKRAAVRWGIGRYLYSLPAAWVAIEQRGKSYAISERELPTLNAHLLKLSGQRPAAAMSTIHEDGKDWPGCPIEGVEVLVAYQANKLGKGGIAGDLVNAIRELKDVWDVEAFIVENTGEIATWPKPWRVKAANELRLRCETINVDLSEILQPKGKAA